jgi:hypothetical protein
MPVSVELRGSCSLSEPCNLVCLVYMRTQCLLTLRSWCSAAAHLPVGQQLLVERRDVFCRPGALFLALVRLGEHQSERHLHRHTVLGLGSQ